MSFRTVVNFAVDLSDENGKTVGTLEYEGNINPTRIVNDIKHFYETGEVRDAVRA